MFSALKSLSDLNAIAPFLAAALSALSASAEYFCLNKAVLITIALSATSEILLTL